MSALLLALHTGHRTKVTHTQVFLFCFFVFRFLFVCLLERFIFFIYI